MRARLASSTPTVTAALRRSCVTLLAGAFLITSPGPHGVRPASAANGDADVAASLQKFDAGRKAFESGAFEESLAAFQASNALSASPNSRLYIARCYRALGKVARAYTAFRLASREAQDRLTTTREKRFAATRDTASSEAAELEPKVPRLLVVVPGHPSDGFAVKQNGEDVPPAAWGVAVETDPGDVTIEASGPRLVPFKQVVHVSEGARARVDVVLARVPTAVLTIALKSRPAGLAVAIDATPVDATRAEVPREVDVGEHSVSVEAPGYLPYHWARSLAGGASVTVNVALQPDVQMIQGASRATPKWLLVTVGAGAVVALGAASVLAFEAKAASDAQQALDPLLRSQAKKSQIDAFSLAADTLFITGGVLGLGAGVLVFTTKWHDDAPREERARLAPWATPTGGGLAVSGRF
jgi:hypothetical protein